MQLEPVVEKMILHFIQWHQN